MYHVWLDSVTTLPCMAIGVHNILSFAQRVILVVNNPSVFLDLLSQTWIMTLDVFKGSAAIGDQHVLACGFRASVLVVPDVDPLWSRVGRFCRQLCNYAVSMTY